MRQFIFPRLALLWGLLIPGLVQAEGVDASRKAEASVASSAGANIGAVAGDIRESSVVIPFDRGRAADSRLALGPEQALLFRWPVESLGLGLADRPTTAPPPDRRSAGNAGKDSEGSTGARDVINPDVCTGVICEDGDPCTMDFCDAGAGGCVYYPYPCCGQPDPCCGDPCCGDPCCLDPCCGDPCCGDPCCGDPCCGDPCCGDPCCGDPCCGDPCCGNPDPCCNNPEPCCGVVCDDGDPCTYDYCDTGTGGCAIMVMDPCCGNPDPCCSNPDPCCGVVCDDGDPCTYDYCDTGTGGCASTVMDPCCGNPDPCCSNPDPCCGVVCDDGDPCTYDYCDTGTGGCTSMVMDPCCGNPDPCCNNPEPCCGVVCDDGDPCTYDYCDTGTGTCTSMVMDPCCGNPDPCCNNPDPCCGVVCDDGDLCTYDYCDSAGGCFYEPVSCDDGNPCTTEYCDSGTGTCVVATVECDDGDLCTYDYCDSATGGCIYEPIPCDDGDPCTTEYCDSASGTCIVTPVECDDGDLCTYDYCDSATGGCIYEPIPCDDGDPCTTEYCDSATGTCIVTPVECDDGDACTYDYCDPDSGGCVYEYTYCDDGDLCTYDYCDPDTGECYYEPVVCDDRNECTDDYCDPATGECVYVPVTEPRPGCDCGESEPGPCNDEDSPGCGDSNCCTQNTCEIQDGYPVCVVNYAPSGRKPNACGTSVSGPCNDKDDPGCGDSDCCTHNECHCDGAGNASCHIVTVPCGACCHGNATCDERPKAECNGANDTYKGDGTSCGSYKPTITVHPKNADVCVAGNAMFSVTATASCGTLHYKWKKNGAAVGGDSATLTLMNVALADNGASITVDVLDDCAKVTSNAATLTVREGTRNRAFRAADAGLNGPVAASIPLGRCVYGLTYPESVTITIGAECNGAQWCAVMRSLVGNYSLQARLLPGQREVTGIGGNTTMANYCAQVTELAMLGGCPGAWYMLAAVQAHENVHLTRFSPAIQASAAAIEREVEMLCVPHMPGMTEAMAIARIQALPGWATAVANGQRTWLAQVLARVAGDHAAGGPTDTAEHGVVDPMIAAICRHARMQMPPWPACAACPP